MCSLWNVLNQGIDFPSGNATADLRIAFKNFQIHLRVLGQTDNAASVVYTNILLRRNHNSGVQRVFDTTHHQLRSCNLSGRDFVAQCSRNVDGILKARPNKRRFRKQNLIWDELENIKESWDTIMRIYYDDFMPVFVRHLDLMSPAEIARRNMTTQNYWYRHWQLQKEHDRGMEMIEDYRTKIRLDRNKFRSEMRRLTEKSGLDRRLDTANEPQRHVQRRFHRTI